jgi:hypothetical protein
VKVKVGDTVGVIPGVSLDSYFLEIKPTQDLYSSIVPRNNIK